MKRVIEILKLWKIKEEICQHIYRKMSVLYFVKLSDKCKGKPIWLTFSAFLTSRIQRQGPLQGIK